MRKTEALAQYIPKHSVVAVHTCRLARHRSLLQRAVPSSWLHTAQCNPELMPTVDWQKSLDIPQIPCTASVCNAWCDPRHVCHKDNKSLRRRFLKQIRVAACRLKASILWQPWAGADIFAAHAFAWEQQR